MNPYDTKIEQMEVTNNELARMIAEGFRNTATKDDIIAVREEIREVLEHIAVVDDRVSTVQHGMVRVADYLHLEKRVDVLEDKVGELAGQQ